jgi:hypothetical protein
MAAIRSRLRSGRKSNEADDAGAMHNVFAQ